jgi:glutathione S-transferase
MQLYTEGIQEMTLNIKEIAGDKYILWGANWSLYTAKVRPYLIKKGIEYVELNPSHPDFNERIVPHVGYITHPVLETPKGEIIADSMEIMEFLDPRFPDLPMLPEDKSLSALAHLIHSYGSEGLTKHAMYWRWDTTYENRVFARGEFSRSQETRSQREASNSKIGDAFAVSMRSFVPVLGMGLSHEVDVAVETSTERLYDTLNAHFLDYPYILGGVPSLADYGMMGAIYAHLGRDVSPTHKLKVRAPALYRWIETMGRPPIVDPEVWHVPQEYFAIDDLPETLIALLELIAEEYVPEIRATIDCYHQWLGAPDARPAGAIVDVEGKKRCHQVLGEIEHAHKDVSIKRIGLLDSVELHMRFQEVAEQMSAGEMKTLNGILQRAGAGDFANLRLKRNMKRHDCTYVLV